MSERTVRQSMAHRRVVSLAPDASVFEAACTMTRANCGSVLVIDGGGLQGILTERDLMTRVMAKELDPAATPVWKVMTRQPRCISPDSRVSDAVVIMLEGGFRHLPIVADGGRILGVFSIRDALPREVESAASVADFNEQVNDALG